jgi:SAM-dependent methyltransferase
VPARGGKVADVERVRTEVQAIVTNDTAGGYDQYAFVADLYDHVGPYVDRGDVAFFVDAATRAGSPVLEIGCGTGRVLIPTARAGLDVVGLDLSPHMLAVCRRNLERETEDVRSRVQLVEADMRRFDLGRTFTLATIPFRPFQHLLTVADQLECLRSIARHLVDDGMLVLDLFNPWLEALIKHTVGVEWGDEPEFTTPDGRRVRRTHSTLAENRFEQVNRFALNYYVTHPDGREERLVHEFSMRYLYRFEAEHLLARAGFQVEQVFADYDKSPYGSKYPGELLFVARKRAPLR